MLRSILFSVTVILACNLSAQAAPTQWAVASGGNGHWYELVDNNPLNWEAAQAYAESRGGYLATITSAGENSFVVTALDIASLPGCRCTWLGGLQNSSSPAYSEPSGGWEWVTGEPFIYSNWQSGEPNNSGDERYLTFWFQAGAWNDHFQDAFPRQVIEWDTDPSAQPSEFSSTFNVETSDVPAMYPPYTFDPRGPLHSPSISESTPTDSTVRVQNGAVHFSRGMAGAASSVPFASPELSLRALDLFGVSSFPVNFFVHFDIGGTPGNESWWGPGVSFGDGVNFDITSGFAPGYCQAAFSFCDQGTGLCSDPATPSRCWETDVLYSVNIWVTTVENGYRFHTLIRDPASQVMYADQSDVDYPHSISRIALHRQGHGGGDALFDNVVVGLPEPRIDAMVALGLLGIFSLCRQRRR